MTRPRKVVVSNLRAFGAKSRSAASSKFLPTVLPRLKAILPRAQMRAPSGSLHGLDLACGDLKGANLRV